MPEMEMQLPKPATIRRLCRDKKCYTKYDKNSKSV